MRRFGVVVLTAATVALSACSSSSGGTKQTGSARPTDAIVTSSAAAPSSSKPAAAANPVTILRKIEKCKLPPGAVSGDEDVNGDRMASCQIPQPGVSDSTAGEQVTIYTNGDSVALQTNTAQIKSDDDGARIDGTGYVIDVVGVLDLDTNGTSYYVKPKVIARQVGGKLQPHS